MPGDVTVFNNMIAISGAGTSRMSLFNMNGTYITRFGSQNNTLTGEVEMPEGITTGARILSFPEQIELLSIWGIDHDASRQEENVMERSFSLQRVILRGIIPLLHIRRYGNCHRNLLIWKPG